jgi:putative transposase
MQVHPSGYYAWLKCPISNRDLENTKLLSHIKESHEQSGKIYGYRTVHKDLVASGIKVNKKRVARLMNISSISGFVTNKRKPRHKAGSAHRAHPNHLAQCFRVKTPNEVWVTDITYIRTYEGWLYLAVVLDLFSRKIVGWALSGRITTALALEALRMATVRQKPKSSVMVHSDQGSQYSSYEWQAMLKVYNLTPSMSRRGNCYDNAVAESFFKSFKRECVKKQVYITREEAKSDIFHYIEMFYNSKRRHSYLGYICPNEFERRYNQGLQENEALTE